MQNHEQKSGRKSLNPQEKKDKNKSLVTKLRIINLKIDNQMF